jgi:sigma-B regulation protein RsbU (phosphoserine phosphatase)
MDAPTTTSPPTQSTQAPWQQELDLVVEMMRDISRYTDPQQAAMRYARGIRESGFFPADHYLSLSRRGLQYPEYRITRSTTWKENIDPWRDVDKLPLLKGGLLGELIYSNESAVIEDLPSRLRRDDPAYEYLQGMELLISAPHFDDGVALNMGVSLMKQADQFPMDKVPGLVLQANLWGRGVRNLVLRKELQAAYEALDREMQVVGEIQRTLLPATLPSIMGLDVAAYYLTARRSGGDYYDFFSCPDSNHCGLCIADVSGHGTPAAVIMAITHAIAHLHPGHGAPPSELLAFVNRQLAQRYIGGSGAFVTAFYGVYDAEKRQLTYARAGHNPPRLLRDGKMKGLDEVGGFPLGIIEDELYPECTLQLQPGDLVFLYTDGITEAKNADGEMFGVEAMDAALCAGPPTAQAAIDRVLASLKKFSDPPAPADDQTLLAVAVKSGPVE